MSNGETVVWGGVFKNENLTKSGKSTLVLGDIPYLGTLCKSPKQLQHGWAKAKERNADFHHAQNSL